MSLSLSFAQANAICRNWAPIGENVFDYSEQLRRSGFSAFVPRMKFVESFAASGEEVQIHRRCVVELAKERLGRPAGFPIFDAEFKDLYFSPFLEELRAKRDLDNRCSERDLSSRFDGGEAVWRREIDPCRRRLVQHSVTRKSEHDSMFQKMLENERRLAEEEARAEASPMTRTGSMSDERMRYSCFSAVMERDASALGFNRDKKRSRDDRPIFVKVVAADWNLYWQVDDRKFFYISPNEGRFVPILYLASSKIGRKKTGPGEILPIRYTSVVDGLTVAYWAFGDFSQLERAMKAHLFLYGLVAERVEQSVRRFLESR